MNRLPEHLSPFPATGLLDSLPAGVVLLRGLEVVYCNEALTRMFGMAASALLGTDFTDWIAPADRERVLSRHGARIQGDPVPANYEIQLRLQGGRLLRVDIEPRALDTAHVIVLVRDVSAAARDIDLANRLTELALRLQRQQSIDAVIRTAQTGLAEMHFHLNAFRLDDDGNLTIRSKSPPRLQELLLERLGVGFSELRFPLDRIPTILRSLHEKRAIYLEDADAWMRRALPTAGVPADLVEALASAGMVSKGVLAPLYIAEKPWGALFIGADTLTPRDAATIMLFASQFATAIDVARTITELNHTNQNLQAIHELARLGSEHELDRILPRLLAMSAATTRSDRSMIYLFDEEGSEPLFAGSHGVDTNGQDIGIPSHVSGPLHEVITERRPISISSSDPGEVKETLVLPLQIRGILCGVLSLGRVHGERYTEDEIRAVEPFTAQLAIQVETARLFEEERRRVQDLSQINELGRQLSQHLDIPALVSLGIEHLSRLVDIPQIFLSLIEPEQSVLRVFASNLGTPEAMGIELPHDEPSTAFAAIREMRPVVVTDPLSDPRGSRALSHRFGHRAQLGIPLISRGVAIGAIVLAETRPDRRFRPAEVERAVTIANQVAAAIAGARLFEEERNRVRELSLHSEIGRIASSTLQTESLLHECLVSICNNLGFNLAGAWLADTTHEGEPAAEHLNSPAFPQLERARQLAAGLAQKVFLSATPQTAGDNRSGSDVFACAIPLFASSEVTGVFTFVRSDRAPNAYELRLLEAIAPEVGVALQNAFLFADAKRRVEELRLLMEVGRAITGSLDFDEILQTSATTASRLVDSSNAFILLRDPATRELRGAACSNPLWRDHFRTVRIPLDADAIPAVCVRTREPLVISDVANSRFANSTRVKLYGERSVLALPLMVRDEAIGCLLVDDVRRPRSWDPQEMERATVIAHQIAIAMANARLYEDLKQSYSKLARAQEELVKRERLAALGELSAVVAHEVRNPLGVIFNSLGSLRRMLHVTGDAAMLLDIVEEEADRLDRIVRDLLDFARPHEPTLEWESVSELLRDSLQALEHAIVPTGVEVEADIPSNLPRVRLDQRMIRQVLLNLLLNGMQSMPRGGVLHVRAEIEQAQSEPSWLRIEIEDEGSGVPPELANRLFQPFFTTKAAGTGLGLAVVKRFIEAHRGTISFRSLPEAGTSFTLRLPLDGAN